MPDFRQQLILFKPMRPGVSGYARLQSERGALLAQVNARGLDVDGVRAYWYGAGGEARLMGEARVNAHGEASLTAELPMDALAPERLQAVLLLSGGANPAPLMIGLCVRQSAGSLLDAKNAALALCERLARAQQAQSATRTSGQPVSGAGSEPSACPAAEPAPPPIRPAPQPQVTTAKRPRKRERELPREIFLPAIDPLPYVDAARRAMGEAPAERGGPQSAVAEGKGACREIRACEPQAAAGENARGMPAPQADCQAPDKSAPCPVPEEGPAYAAAPVQSGGTGTDAAEEADVPPEFSPVPQTPPADRLRPLVWPRGFEALRTYFVKGLPCRLFDLPGWRFVNAAQAGGPDGLWVGMQQVDGRVCRVAYAHRSETPPPGGRPYRPARGTDGHTYQVLWQRV